MKSEEASIPALARASRDYFNEQCKKSGYFVYKEIEKPQKSVAIFGDSHNDYFLDNEIYEAQKSAEKAQGKYIEYFKASMGDSYQRDLERLFLHENNQSSFLFVELLHHKNGEATRYSPETMKSHQYITINIPQSRYGYVWRDVSAQEDIEHWVTKNQLKVIDLEKNEVVAERIAYTLSRHPGATNWYVEAKNRSDHSAFSRRSEAVYCPYNMEERDADWIKHLLLGTPFF
ncbi:hypothetical protein FACS189441_5960 [Betaproteobacteria bacterium]|nr:hypothetical protein FACS189441_5960 [Betaproteobacteria bacterium]